MSYTDYHRPGDIIRITSCNGDLSLVRHMIIYNHMPQSDWSREDMIKVSDILKHDWSNNFYRYLDLDTGEVKIGYIATSSQTYKIERL